MMYKLSIGKMTNQEVDSTNQKFYGDPIEQNLNES